MARLTLNGMYQYDNTLFDGVILPSGYDRDYVIAEIMNRSGQLYPYFQVPGIIKTNINNWFARNYFNFEKMMEALTAEYNPIENYNRLEAWTRTPNLTDKSTLSGSDSSQLSGSDSLQLSGSDSVQASGDDVIKHTGTDHNTHNYDTLNPYTENVTKGAGPHTTEEQVSAYDSSTYQPSKKTSETFGATAGDRTDSKEITGSYKEDYEHGHTETTTNGRKDTTTFGRKDTTTFGKKDTMTYGKVDTETHTGTESFRSNIHGNIGVTTNQQMIEAELELRKFDIYTDIAARFEHEFIVQVY